MKVFLFLIVAAMFAALFVFTNPHPIMLVPAGMDGSSP